MPRFWKNDKLLAVLAAVLLGLVLLRLAGTLRFDYDEVAELHAVWQVSQGSQPYVDFYYDHPPYFWLVFSPLMSLLPESFGSLVRLRLVNVLFSGAALALFLLLLLRREIDRSWKVCSVGAVCLMALQVPVLTVLSQFRADHASLALTMGGLLLLEGEGKPRPARWAWAGALFCGAGMLTPKLVLLYAAALGVYGLDAWLRDRKTGLRCAAALLAGGAGAFVMGNLISLACGIDPRPFYRWAVEHHASALGVPGYRFGLARGLLLRASYNPLLLLVFLAGLWAAARELLKNGWRREKALAVFLIFIVGQPLWVKYLWDQYLFTVVLAAAFPLAVCFHRVARSRGMVLQAGVSLLFLAGILYSLPDASRYIHARQGLDRQVRTGDKLLEWAPRGVPVSMQPPDHVVFRENSTFFFNYTIVPRGPGTEELMQESPELRDLFRFEGYLDQLERRPPSLIQANPGYSGRQYRQAVARYLERHPREYEQRTALDATVLVRRSKPVRVEPAAEVFSTRR